jgi:hypothetical protein
MLKSTATTEKARISEIARGVKKTPEHVLAERNAAELAAKRDAAAAEIRDLIGDTNAPGRDARLRELEKRQQELKQQLHTAKALLPNFRSERAERMTKALTGRRADACRQILELIEQLREPLGELHDVHGELRAAGADVAYVPQVGVLAPLHELATKFK